MQRLIADRFGIPEESHWPLEGPVDNSDIGLPHLLQELDGAFRVDLRRDGSVMICMRDDPLTDSALPVYYHDDRTRLLQVRILTCHLGYERDHDRRYYWRWFQVPGTHWQLNAVQRIYHLFMSERDYGIDPWVEACRLDALVESEKLLLEAQDQAAMTRAQGNVVIGGIS